MTKLKRIGAAMVVVTFTTVSLAQERLHQWPLDDREETCALRDLYRRQGEINDARKKVEDMARYLDGQQKLLSTDAAEITSRVCHRHQIPKDVQWEPDFDKGVLNEVQPKR